jgi:GMP synthase-like glutamine amidotransferase
LLVLQPSDVDPPERLGDAGADLTVRRPASDGVPESLADVDGVVCMGGEMGVHDDAAHPWLAALRWLLADALARWLPGLGVCLGGRLSPEATLLASSPRHPHQAFRVGTSGYGLQFHIETSPATVLSWARRAAADVFPPRQLDPDHLEQVHADIAQAWQPLVARFVSLAAGELAPAVGPADRRALPLLGH